MGNTQSEEPEPADLIEIPRGLYSHWGVYVGNRQVVHLTVPDGALGSSSSNSASARKKKGLVTKERLSKISAGGRFRINKQYDKEFAPRPRDQILRDAEALVGKEVDYHLLRNNCEHFATELRYGVPKSIQGDAGRAAFLGEED